VVQIKTFPKNYSGLPELQLKLKANTSTKECVSDSPEEPNCPKGRADQKKVVTSHFKRKDELYTKWQRKIEFDD